MVCRYRLYVLHHGFLNKWQVYRLHLRCCNVLGFSKSVTPPHTHTHAHLPINDCLELHIAYVSELRRVGRMSLWFSGVPPMWTKDQVSDWSPSASWGRARCLLAVFWALCRFFPVTFTTIGCHRVINSAYCFAGQWGKSVWVLTYKKTMGPNSHHHLCSEMSGSRGAVWREGSGMMMLSHKTFPWPFQRGASACPPSPCGYSLCT